MGGKDLEAGVVQLVVLDRILRATTKTSRQLFKGQKCTPAEMQNPGYDYGLARISHD